MEERTQRLSEAIARALRKRPQADENLKEFDVNGRVDLYEIANAIRDELQISDDV